MLSLSASGVTNGVNSSLQEPDRAAPQYIYPILHRRWVADLGDVCPYSSSSSSDDIPEHISWRGRNYSTLLAI